MCAVCGSRIARDTKSHGRPRWVCANPDCGAIVRTSDEEVQKRVSQRLRQLANTPDLLTLPPAPEAAPSADALRIQNELNLCFNRPDIKRVTWRVNCVLTHCAPTSIQQKLDRNYTPDRLTDFLQMVKRRCQFDYWFLGHYHRNCVVDDRFIIQWKQMVELQRE